MRLKSVRKRGYHVSTNGIGVGMLTGHSGRRDPPDVDHCRRSQPEQVRHLAGSGPQLACGRQNGGSPGALDAGRRRRGFHGVQVRSG